MGGRFDNSAGVFTHRSGTVYINNPASHTLRNISAFNHLTINDSLVAHWKLDENSAGASVLDASGNAHHGTHVNTPTYQTTAAEKAPLVIANTSSMDFNGTTQYVNCPDIPDLKGINAFTVSAWAKTDTLAAPGSGAALRMVVSQEANAAGGTFGIRLDTTTDKFQCYASANGSDAQVTWGTVAAINTWYHLVMTYDGANVTLIINNGTPLTTAKTGLTGGFPKRYRIGAYHDGPPDDDLTGTLYSRWWDGRIDDVRVYARVLTATEITTLYTGYNATGNKATQTLAANLDVDGDLTLTSGNLDVDATGNYGIAVGGSWVNNGAVFTPRAGTVTFDGTAIGKTITALGRPFSGVTVNGVGGVWSLADLANVTATATSALTLSNGVLALAGKNLTLTGATFSNQATLRLQGGETITGITQDIDSGTWEYVGNGDAAAQTLTIRDCGVTDYFNLLINDANVTQDTFAVGAGLTCAGSLNVTSSTFSQGANAISVGGDVTVATAGIYTGGAATLAITGGFTQSGGTFTAPDLVTVAGNFARTAGTFTPGAAGRVTLNGTDQQISGTTTFRHLRKIVTVARTLTFAAGSRQTVLGELNLEGPAATTHLTLASSSPGTRWEIDPQGTKAISRVSVSWSENVAAAVVAPTGSQDGRNTINWFADANAIWDGGGGADTNWSTIGNWTNDSLPLSTDVAVFNPTYSTNSCVIDASATATVLGIQVVTGYTGIITQSATKALTIGASGIVMAAGALTGSSAGTSAENITVSGPLTMTGGTFTSTRSTLSVSDAFTVGAGADFVHNSGTVLLKSASNRVLTCSDAFNHLILNDCLTAYWSFDEASSPSLDRSGNGHHATWQGGPVRDITVKPTLANDNIASMDLDGAGQYLSLATPAAFQTSAITVAAWLYVPAGPTWDAAGNYRPIFNVTDGTTGYSLIGSAGAEVMMFRGIYNSTSPALPSRGTWHHITGTYTAATHTCYRDGQTDGPINYGGTLTHPASANAWIGRNSRSGGYYINAQIDELRIYSVAVDAAVIARLAAGGNPMNVTSTVTLASTLDVNGDLTIASGGLNAATYDISVAGSWTNSGGTLTHGSRTVNLDGATGGTIDSGESAFSDLHVAVTAPTAWTLRAPLDIDRDLLLDGVGIAAGARTITLGRHWRNTLGTGAFTAGTGTVTLDGANQEVSGSTNFHHFTKAVAVTDTLTFAASQRQTFTGTFTLQGANGGRRLSLRSSIAGTYADISPQGTRAC
ncbi:MAG: LamG domain-containing protein, partial [Planctomycetes bacterium]|nr:LamG domain-containing protein [Planctomycetota bacterium]